MPDNRDSVMVVCDFPGANPPAGWTHFDNDDLIAKRVLWPDFEKLHLIGRKVVLIKVYQRNGSGQSPFATEYSGNDAYGHEYDVVNNCFRISQYNDTGGQAGTKRTDHLADTGSGGGASENWPKTQGQVPMGKIQHQDAGPNTSQLAAAQALNTDDVGLT